MRQFILTILLQSLVIATSSAGPTGNAIAEGLKNLNGPAKATVEVQTPLWTYTVVNEAPKDSGLTINSFNFDLYGPAEPVNLPKGWTVDTDGKKYILWTTEKNGIRPGETLKFQLKSQLKGSREAYAMIISWDDKKGAAGPVSASVVKIPSRK